jgi:hypothetical protein
LPLSQPDPRERLIEKEVLVWGKGKKERAREREICDFRERERERGREGLFPLAQNRAVREREEREIGAREREREGLFLEMDIDVFR